MLCQPIRTQLITALLQILADGMAEYPSNVEFVFAAAQLEANFGDGLAGGRAACTLYREGSTQRSPKARSDSALT